MALRGIGILVGAFHHISMHSKNAIEPTKPGRLFFIDNIRWLMIVFVIMVHAAVTYSGIGSWYYIEHRKLDTASLVFFVIFQAFMQAYFMGLLFLIAGYFVPSAFDRKGFLKFLGDRSVRLGIPTLIYMLFINTIIVYYILAFQWSTPRPPVGQYFMNYILNPSFLGGSGPMWFAFALLVFSAAYAVFRLFSHNHLSYNHFLHNPQGSKGDAALPGHLAVVELILLISICSFIVRLVQPIGTSIMNMQLGFFAQYIILFIAGIIAYRKNWLARIPYSFGMTWFKIALIGGTISLAAIMILGGGISGDFSRYAGGLYWQSAAYALWESFFCVGVSLGIIVLFRERFNSQGKFTGFMSQNSFSAYVFHAPILILVTLAIRNFSWHPILKFMAAVAIAIPLCFLASHFVFRRIPLLKKVL
ncbi:MAG: acyltransferase family protein [Methanotrichaceae archaeon]